MTEKTTVSGIRITRRAGGFAAAVATLEKELERRGIPVFAKFDHRKNALGVNLPLGRCMVLVFGSPAVGTLLMQANPSVAFELPLRIAVWEEDDAACLATPDMANLAERYGLSGLPAIEKIQTLLDELTAAVE